MDIMHLIDRLEELFNESRPIPFTHNVVVDEDRMLDLIDQMRVSIPDEVKKSQQVLSQRDRILAQAQEAANRTVQLAREKSEELVDRDPIAQAAHLRSDEILRQAREEANAIRREADDYVVMTLSQLDGELSRVLGQVRNGIQMLHASLPDQREVIQEEEGA
jgi:cell division septum initiation protein DivIVA